jgi:hypothetical protein
VPPLLKSFENFMANIYTLVQKRFLEVVKTFFTGGLKTITMPLIVKNK